jgi:DDE_Tnp_1-associated/Transposase DDE domain
MYGSDALDAAVNNAVFVVVLFLQFFADLSDPRQIGKICYPLNEILLLMLLAVLAGADGFVEIADWGKAKLSFLRRFLPFENGTPSHDQLGFVCSVLKAEEFQKCFGSWVASTTGVSPDVIAIDGKTSRRSGCKKIGKAAIHMVSAFAAEQRLVLGQIKVEEKSNEITAIPKLLEMIDIEGATITIDAMGCQREISQKIIEKNGNYILSLKGNQGSLQEDVEVFIAEHQKALQDPAHLTDNTPIQLPPSATTHPEDLASTQREQEVVGFVADKQETLQNPEHLTDTMPSLAVSSIQLLAPATIPAPPPSAQAEPGSPQNLPDNRKSVQQSKKPCKRLPDSTKDAEKHQDLRISRHRTIEKDHGRIETRTATVIHDVEWLQQRHKWPGLKSVVIIDSEREINGKIEKERRPIVSSTRASFIFRLLMITPNRHCAKSEVIGV